jgi:methylglutaconyl-CoA hydratase
METGIIQTIINKGVAYITFSHPASNSFPSSLLANLVTELQHCNINPDVKIIVLKSEGTTTFCAGASFDELLQISNFEQGTRFFSGFANVINAMKNCSKLIIGRIHGKAVGGGVGLAAACDYAFGTTQSSIKLSEIAIGIGPFVIEPAVTRKMGKNALTTLTLNPTNWQSASWAKENGLFAKNFESIEDLDQHIELFTENLATYNPDALTEIKKVFWENTHHWDTFLHERAAISGKLVLSDFTKKALQDFKK